MYVLLTCVAGISTPFRARVCLLPLPVFIFCGIAVILGTALIFRVWKVRRPNCYLSHTERTLQLAKFRGLVSQIRLCIMCVWFPFVTLFIAGNYLCADLGCRHSAYSD